MKKVLFLLALVLVIVAFAYFSGQYLGHNADMELGTPNIDFNYITENAKLDVLTAEVSILEDMTIGDEASPDYKRIYSQKGTVVYSVDLSKVIPYTASNGDKTIVFIPLQDLDATLYIDESTTNKIAEFQTGRFTGSAKDGYSAYLETARNSYAEMERTIKDYSGLLSMAEKEAREQVRMLIEETIVGKNISVEVFFSERSEDGV